MADISPDNLFKALTGSFSPDANQRREAENFITAAQRQQGFMQALCRVWIEDQVESVIRQSAAIQVKNGIKNFWSRRVQYDGSVQQITEPGPSGYELCDADKQFVLDNIVDIAVHAKGDAKLRNLAIECVRECIRREYPACWTKLLPQALGLITATDDSNKVMVGLLVVRKISREFEMKARGRPGRESLDAVIVQALPPMLQLGEKLYSGAEAMDTQAIDMLRVIAKTFHSCIQTSLHESLITDHASCGRWMELFLKCSTMLTVPVNKLPADNDMRQQMPLAKLQKWTMRNIHRFIGRFGNPRLVAAHESDANVAAVMTNFAQWWLDTFGPGMTQQMIELLQRRATQGIFVSDQVLCQVFGFVAEAVQHAITYKIIKPHVQFLVHDVVLPVLAFSQEDQQLWESDPEEYIRRQAACEAIFSDPRSAAGDLLRALVSYRGRDSLAVIMVSVSADLDACSRVGDKNDMQACCKKDGALNALENIAEQLAIAAVDKSGKSKKSKKGKKKQSSALENQLPNVDSLQQMLVNVVLPEFKSQCAFLRLRACSTFAAFVTEKISFSNEVFNAAFVATKACLSDSELPVRVQAGSSIKAFFSDCSDQMRPVVAQSVPEVIDRLLRLTQEVDSESLASTLDTMATDFSDAVGPYASQAVNHLVPAFLRQMKAEENDDDATMAAMGTIQTILSLMESVFKNPAALAQCEQSICALLDALFVPDGIDYLEDGLEILTGVTFTAPQPLPESLWKYYCLMYQACCGGSLPGFELTGPLAEGWAADYIENMLGPLDNYLSRGTQTWLTGSSPTGMRYTEMLYNIVKKGFEMQDDFAAVQSAKIAALVFENCKAGQADEWIEPYVSFLAGALKTCDKSKSKQDLLRWILYAFVMMLWYSPTAFIAVLDKHSLTLDVLSAIVQGASLLRSHDEKKALILALGNLLRSMLQLPSHVQGTCQKVVQTVYEQCKEVQSMRLKAKEKAAHKGDDDEDDDGSDWVDEDDDGLIQDLGDDEDASASRQVMLMQEVRAQLMAVLSGEVSDDDDDSDYDDDEEDENKTSALDPYDEFMYMGETLSQCPALLQQIAPQDQENWKKIIQERANQLAQKKQN
ncbi:hypothetical protein FOL47_005371 [Perkinsus chesapeaki]|uniref:Importin N-terminal domain-containing protein n=1 Tax=Perkinsus chesapeaki TaxID=330153 RepID=A0A7J6N2G6_PERCH|nr:hypothetical protein FOL47_005371 [Perkinsus chesapeaki]